MTLSYDGGAALVAGGSGGIGAAIVRRLAACGLPLALTYHRGKEAAETLLGDCPAPGVMAAFPWATAAHAEAQRLVQRVNDELGPVRFLVVASGVAQDAAFHRLDEAEVLRLLEVNLAAAIALARATLTSMMKAGAGRVVFVGSIAGRRGMAGQTIYAATKAGLEGLTRALAREAGAFGVTVNCVAPGFIETPMSGAAPPRLRAEWLARTPLGRAGRPEEVADLVAYLLSREAAYLTGQTLVIDGGLSA